MARRIRLTKLLVSGNDVGRPVDPFNQKEAIRLIEILSIVAY